MRDLRNLSTSKGHINILQETAGNYKDIGAILLHDRTGARVAGVTNNGRDGIIEAVRAVYQQWIQEDEDHSWEKLTKCFRDVQLNSLARDIEQHLGLPSRSNLGNNNNYYRVSYYIINSFFNRKGT